MRPAGDGCSERKLRPKETKQLHRDASKRNSGNLWQEHIYTARTEIDVKSSDSGQELYCGLSIEAKNCTAGGPIGHLCTNPHCGKVLKIKFAHDKNRNHATRAVIFARVSSCAKSSPEYAEYSMVRPGYDGDTHRATCAQDDEHVAQPT